MPPTKTWKNDERWFARFFGTERTPLSGGNSRHTRSDTLHPELFIEAKRRKNHYLVQLYRDTAKLAKKEGKIPMVCPVMPRGIEKLVLIDVRNIVKVADIIRRLSSGRIVRFSANTERNSNE